MKIEDLRTSKPKAERVQNATRIFALILAFVTVFFFFFKIVFF